MTLIITDSTDGIRKKELLLISVIGAYRCHQWWLEHVLSGGIDGDALGRSRSGASSGARQPGIGASDHIRGRGIAGGRREIVKEHNTAGGAIGDKQLAGAAYHRNLGRIA